jgi:hypothetical protein
LLPALAVIDEESPRTAYAANFIQVTYRLQHHLDPNRYPVSAYAGHGLLLTFWWIGRRYGAFTRHERFFSRFLAASALIAAAGLVIGLGPRPLAELPLLEWRLRFLKFYPFRLFDVTTLIAASALAAALAQRWWDRRPAWRRVRVPESESMRVTKPDTALPSHPHTRRLWHTGSVFGLALLFALLAPSVSRNPSQMSTARLTDWLDVCRWVAAEAPADALVLTPNESWAFKWYAARAEFVTFKDVPQDAAGIIEWNRRLRFEKRWFSDNYADKLYSAAELRKLHEKTGVTHLIVRRLGPFEGEPIFENATYRVYATR